MSSLFTEYMEIIEQKYEEGKISEEEFYKYNETLIRWIDVAITKLTEEYV